MLDAMGQKMTKPRLRGAAIPPPSARGPPAHAPLSVYHYAASPDAHPVGTVRSEAQRHALAQEMLKSQDRISGRWHRDAGPSGVGPIRPPYALVPPSTPGGSDDDPYAPGGRRAASGRDDTAGMPTARDLIGAAKLGGLTDFGLAPAPEPRSRPVGQEKFKLVSAAVLRAGSQDASSPLTGRGAGPRGAAAAFASPRLRPEELYENPRMMKHRDLRSKPQCLGFVFPNAKHSEPRGGDAAVEDSVVQDAQRLTEYYPLSHCVLQAQYRLNGTSHCL